MLAIPALATRRAALRSIFNCKSCTVADAAVNLPRDCVNPLHTLYDPMNCTVLSAIACTSTSATMVIVQRLSCCSSLNTVQALLVWRQTWVLQQRCALRSLFGALLT